MTSIIRVGQSQFASVPIDEDSVERITTCLSSLANYVSTAQGSDHESEVREIFLVDTQKAYAKMVVQEEKKQAEKRAKDSKKKVIQPDDAVSFRQFFKKSGQAEAEEYESALTKATGALDEEEGLLSKLSRVVQLTGAVIAVYHTADLTVQLIYRVLIAPQASPILYMRKHTCTCISSTSTSMCSL